MLRIEAPLCNWLLCWIFLPNVAFAMFWLIGAPPRQSEIVLTGVIGLLVRRASYRVRLTAFGGTMLFSLLSYIAAIFNLAVSETLASLRFFAELDVMQSPLYLTGGAVAVVILAAGAYLLRRDQGFAGGCNLAIAVAALASVTITDYAVSFHSSGSYKRVPSVGMPFESAVASSGLLTHVDGRRHLLVVMVEALGLPREEGLRRQLLGRWQRSDIAARYRVQFGSSAYYGSTTSGEIRELCGRWGDYGQLTARPDRGCLPFRLKKKGYETLAVHGFTSEFFDRRHWYPNIGFSGFLFGEQMLASGMPECPGVFPGACDTAVPALLSKRFKSSQTPLFAYWLTLNSHLPVPAEERMGTAECTGPASLREDMTAGVCRLSVVLSRTMDRLAQMLADPDLPPIDILIVGDHMPPFFDHRSRGLFDEGRVPWILLTPRGDSGRWTSANAASNSTSGLDRRLPLGPAPK